MRLQPLPGHRLLMLFLVFGLYACEGGRGGLSSAPASRSVEPLDTAALDAQEAELQQRGCDPLDAAHCLFPFPSNHFTRPAPAGAPGSVERKGTGRLIHFPLAAMPRNLAGAPIQPREWNRSDGYSPGQLLLARVPDVAILRANDGSPQGPLPNAPSIDNPAAYLQPGSSILVIDAETGQRHPVWAEIDANAGFRSPPGGEPSTQAAEPAVIIRPARNFTEGRRYIVVLRDLRNAQGQPIPAQAVFAACRDHGSAALEASWPGLAARCAALEQRVFPILQDVGIPVTANPNVYVAWDFTVASAASTSGRLKHMRDDAFGRVLGQVEDDQGRILELGAAPDFTVGSQVVDDDFLEIRGTMQVPSYVLPVDPSPLEESAPINAIDAVLAALEEQQPLNEVAGPLRDVLRIGSSASLPPNRLNYLPDAVYPDDPVLSLWGDGLPDQSGTINVPFYCRLHEQSTSANPARAGVYGHGLLDSRQAVSYDRVPQFSRATNFFFCAVDWFGFAQGDIPNVAAMLLDLSLFPAVPDASQQGMLNMLFLARLLRHPDGFAAHPAFQDAGGPRFLSDHVYFHGISQGGILGGVVVAMSKDITRGVLGVPGMAYSILLQRSTGFSGPIAEPVPLSFATPLYTAYTSDLDRALAFGLIQMLWDRAENNGYAQHIADNRVLQGPDNHVLLRPAWADHQVTHWSAYALARTIGVDIADVMFRSPEQCGDAVRFCYSSRAQWAREREVDVDLLWGLPLAERDVAYAQPGGPASLAAQQQSALIVWDEGETAAPPLANIPPNWKDDRDPHSYPRDAPGSFCQQSHFLHPQGRVIDVRAVAVGADCPAWPDPAQPQR